MTAVSSVADVDAWISQLSECKQLPEADIKKLCDKVRERVSAVFARDASRSDLENLLSHC